MKESNNDYLERNVVESSDENGSVEVPKLGYFSKVIGSEQENPISNNDSKEKKKEISVKVFNKCDFTENVDDNKQKEKVYLCQKLLMTKLL